MVYIVINSIAYLLSYHFILNDVKIDTRSQHFRAGILIYGAMQSLFGFGVGVCMIRIINSKHPPRQDEVWA